MTERTEGRRAFRVYAGTALIAFATLGLEIALTRLLSVITWYHLAFFAISTAMLGMTAGAVTVYLAPGRFSGERLVSGLTAACVGFALATPAALGILCLIPLGVSDSIAGALAMLLATACCALPFYFSGIAIAAVLTRSPLPVGRVYAADLGGAALGCLAVLAGVELLDVPSLIVLFAAFGAWAATTFAGAGRAGGSSLLLRWLPAVLAVLALVNAAGPAGIAPVYVKGDREDRSTHLRETWNSFSRVVVHQGGWSVPQLWGAAPAMPAQRPVLQFYLDVDGDAGTTIRRYASPDDLGHLAWDVTNAAYHLRPRGGAAVLGVGGGRDVHSALLFGHERVVGVEVNPEFVDLLNGEFGEFAGLAGNGRVRLVADEARSWLSRSDETFSVIQMSLIDTWAATGAGAFSLSENALYTVDAWKIFLARLSGDGIFTVSRWYSPEDLGETGRVCSLAVASLLASGASDPSQHLAMLTTGRISTTLLSARPMSDRDVAALHELAARTGFAVAFAPGSPPDHPLLGGILSARSAAELRATVADAPYDYTAPTDENPYFFNMLRFDRLGEAFSSTPGVVRGNLTATVTLLVLAGCLAVLALATVLLPLMLRRRAAVRPEPVSVSGAVYFSLIGAGFMFAEIALLQRLSVFLGHPVYALAVLLFTVIACTGLGSLLSERLPLGAPARLGAAAVAMAASLATARAVLPPLLGALVAAGMAAKIAVSVALVAPLGVGMGLFFPSGMRLARRIGSADTPWYWALNGVFGVLCSALAVLVAIQFGISANLHLATACYLALVPCVAGMGRLAARGKVAEAPGADADGRSARRAS